MSREDIQSITHALNLLAEKVDCIDSKLDDHIKVTTSHMKEMEPLRDALRTLTYIQRFITWGKVLLITLIGLLAWVYHKQ